MIYCESVKRSKELDIHRFPEPITYFYFQLGCIEVEKNNQADAITFLIKH